ncbi:MAG TPA: sigma-70 family RNA polymerase sigma factor [Solirubrobacteraceae bacterium]
MTTLAAAGAEEPALPRSRAGDAAAFVALIERHDRSLRRLAFRLLGDRDRMDDALQEAYIRAFRSLPRFRARSAPATWLYRIVYNACIDELRRAHAQSAAPLDVAPEAASEQDVADLVVGRSALAEALAALPPEQRAAVLLVDGDGFDYRAAAEVLGVEVGTVASRLSRARSALRQALGAISEGAEER